MSDNLLIRLAALEKENAALRGQTPQPAPAPKAKTKSKMDEVLSQLRDAAQELALPNDPDGDPIEQTAMRTQALANVVAKLAMCVGSGLGATGAVVSELNRVLTETRQDIESVKVFVGANAGPANGTDDDGSTAEVAVVGETGETEMIEVDNTGAENLPVAPAPVAAKPAPTNGGGQKRRQGQAAASAGAPVGPPVNVPAGMPAEVAKLAQSAPVVPVASSTVKS